MNKLLLISFLCAILSSCSIFDREEDIPAFLSIDEFDFTAGDFQGTDSINISEVKVTLNSKNLGIFSLPAVIPILEEGSHEVILSGIIQQDGISTARVLYPFYTSHSEILNFSPLDTTYAFPSISYFEDLDFWVEDFDSSVAFHEINESEGELIRVLSSSDLTYEGNGSAFIEMEPGGTFFKAETSEDFNLPVGRAVFLEMHYSCNHPFITGIKSITGSSEISSDLIGVNPTTSNETQKWNKIYINLTNFVADNSTANSFEVYFKMDKSDLYPEPLVYMDNVKIIY